MVKPAPVSDVMRKYAKPTALSNRFSALSDGPLRTHNSRSLESNPGLHFAQGRDPSNRSSRSVKSGTDENTAARDRSYSLGKRKRGNSCDDEVDYLGEDNDKEVKIAEVNSLIDVTKGQIEKVKEIIKVSSIDETIKNILANLVGIQESIVNNQQVLAKVSMSSTPTPRVNIPPAGSLPFEAFPVMAETGARSKTTGTERAHLRQAPLGNTEPWSEVVRKKAQNPTRRNFNTGNNNGNYNSNPFGSDSVRNATATQVTDPRKKFRDTIKECERSILVHGLDMGKTPTINPSAMNSLATKALLKKASEVDPSADGTGIPSEDYATVIQDVLSTASSVNFFGKRTKLAINKDTKLPEDYYTIPVEYKFPDKETRQAAEESLKLMCKVKMTTAYPANVRECIKQAYDYGKEQFKDSFIIVNLDTAGFRLVMKKRTKEERQWTYVKQGFSLPEECLDTSKKPGTKVKLIIEQISTPTRRMVRGSGSSVVNPVTNEDVFLSPHNNHELMDSNTENGENTAHAPS